MRGSFCGGTPNDSCSVFGSRRGLAPSVLQISLPLLPMNSTPPVLSSSSLPSSTGFGGNSPPSYHVKLTWGRLPRAGNS